MDILKNKWVILLIVIGMGVVSVIGVELTSEAWFCNTCHSMKPEYEAWKQSVHHENHVECKHCHYGPGLWGIIDAKIGGMFQMVHEITGSVAKHSPEEVAEHSGKLILPQNIHTNKKGKVYAIKAVGKHIRNANYRCRKCHDDIVSGERKQTLKWPNKVTINHTNHLAREVEGVKIDCTDCHTEIVHGPYPERRNMPRMIICFECHDGQTAFREDCFNCHTFQRKMHLGTSGVGITDGDLAGYMSEEDCTSCHDEELEYRFNPEACVGCHDESYVETLKEWQADTLAELKKSRELYDDVQGMIEMAGKMGKGLKAPRKLMDEAMYNIRFVDKDGTGGAHNIEYATELLKVANDKLAEAREMLD